MLIFKLSSLSTPSGPTSSFWILLALPPLYPISMCPMDKRPLLTIIYNRKHLKNRPHVPLSFLLSLSLLSSLMNLLRVCRLSEGTLHISLHHTLLRSAPFKVLLLSSLLLSSPPLPSPLSHAALPTCVQPVPRGAPPPITENKLRAIYGSQQAGRQTRIGYFWQRKKKKTSIIMKLGKKSELLISFKLQQAVGINIPSVQWV